MMLVWCQQILHDWLETCIIFLCCFEGFMLTTWFSSSNFHSNAAAVGIRSGRRPCCQHQRNQTVLSLLNSTCFGEKSIRFAPHWDTRKKDIWLVCNCCVGMKMYSPKETVLNTSTDTDMQFASMHAHNGHVLAAHTHARTHAYLVRVIYFAVSGQYKQKFVPCPCFSSWRHCGKDGRQLRRSSLWQAHNGRTKVATDVITCSCMSLKEKVVFGTSTGC